MYTALSILLLAVGAVLTFAVTGDVNGINLDTAGVVLLVVGGIGLFWSLVVNTTVAESRRRYDEDDDVYY